jgi:quaternary ammonium compound-resistance protein SugE
LGKELVWTEIKRTVICVHGRIKAWEILQVSSGPFYFKLMTGVKNMKWVFLVIAGLLEVAWAIGLKYTHGFTKLGPSILTVMGMIASFYFLSLALRSLPLGTAYAIWTGIGAVGTVILGIVLFREPADLIRLICIGFILIGIIGLKISSAH